MYIKLNTNVRPVQTSIRRYPVNKPQKISKRIREVINDGYFDPVNEPTPFFSPMIAVESPEKPNHPIRICMAPVPTLNSVFERPLYPMSKLKKNLHHLVNTKCFTLAYTLVSFSKVLLDRESSISTTIHKPIGLVRWLPLPFGISFTPV